MDISKEWLAFLREQYPVGSRVKLREMKDPHQPVPSGTMGTLTAIDDIGTFHVRWDNGQGLRLVVGEDSFTILPPEPTTMKLYMPLTADFYEKNEWGDTEDTPAVLTENELCPYEGAILKALRNSRMPEEAESGFMHWYNKDDAVQRKVRSVVFTVEERSNRLWGVAECKIIGALAPDEMATLKDYITGQAADGWGEGFEQQEINVEGGSELYVHLWNSENWSLQTEQERFCPHMDKLPELCFTLLPGSGKLICIKRGERGYYPSDWSMDDAAENRRLADEMNGEMGVTPAQEQAMLIGSMCGWDVPGANPDNCQETAAQKGGMQLG